MWKVGRGAEWAVDSVGSLEELLGRRRGRKRRRREEEEVEVKEEEGPVRVKEEEGVGVKEEVVVKEEAAQ